MNEVEIRHCLHIFKSDDRLIEIRAIDSFGKNFSGYYKDIDKLISDAKRHEDKNIYFVLNDIKKSCYCRKQQEQLIQVKDSTKDGDIELREWVLIDLDPKRPTGVSATDDEKQYAKTLANKVFTFLGGYGFNKPVVCDSGNGVHLLYRIQMENDDYSNKLIQSFLNTLWNKFTTSEVDVDLKVFNASRITKLYGTYARKGSDSPDRPHRESKIIKVPDPILLNSANLIQRVVDENKPQKDEPNKFNHFNTPAFSINDFINKHGIQVAKTISNGGSTKYLLEECPFCGNKSPDSAIFQSEGGFGFSCFHNSCNGKGWKQFRAHFEPNAYEKKHFDPYRVNKPVKFKAEDNIVTEEKGAVFEDFCDIKQHSREVIVSIPSGLKLLDESVYGFDKKTVTIWSGSNGCVDCDTEYFDGTQWKKISDYVEGDKVLQYGSDGVASLVYPSEYHKYPCDKLCLIQNYTKSLNQCLSDEHKFVYITSKKNLISKLFIQCKETISKTGEMSGSIIPHFSFNGSGINWTDAEIRLELAISAECHLFEHRLNRKNRVRINLKHQYKKDELERLLNLLCIPYEKKKYAPKDLAFDTYLFYWDKSSKTFPSEWYNMNNEQFKIVKDNITKWDGNVHKKRGGTYSTIKKYNADFIQFAVSSLGYRCSIGKDIRNKNICYYLCFSKNKSLIKLQNKKKLRLEDYKTKDGYKYCFSVPSGMLVLRREDSINITGNSAKSTVLNQVALHAVHEGFKGVLWSGELHKGRLKKWLFQQAAGKQYVEQSKFNAVDYFVRENVQEKIAQWLKGRLRNYNTKYSSEFETIVKEVRKEFASNDFDFIVLDNLMALDIISLDGDKLDKQTTCIRILHELAEELDIAIHIVMHPRKSEGFIRKGDIAGSSNLSNFADAVYIVHRVNDDFIKNATDFWGYEKVGLIKKNEYTNIIECCKHREFGTFEGRIVGLYYEVESKRLLNDPYDHWEYKWNELYYVKQEELLYNYYEPEREQENEYDFLSDNQIIDGLPAF